MIDWASQSDYIVHADNLKVLSALPDDACQLIYIDPPFNTQGLQKRVTLQTTRSPNGDRVGFQGRRYASTILNQMEYHDSYVDYLSFIKPRLEEAWRVLHPTGTLYFHIDYREAHYCKVLLDSIFGRGCFLNEIIWAYDFGGRARDRWPAKHDTILVYVKSPNGQHYFSQDTIDRIPYMAPGLVTAEKAARGKLPTDVWWQTIVPTNSRERTGYPNQKPEPILRRVIQASSRPGDRVLDFFAGSGTTGVAARRLQRRFLLVDDNLAAVEVMSRRLGDSSVLVLNEHGLAVDVDRPADDALF